MVKPESKPKIAKSKVKESKSELFNRLAKIRTEKVLKALRILGNCGNRNNYEYTQEQVDSINLAINKGIENTLDKFTKSKKEIESFEF